MSTARRFYMQGYSWGLIVGVTWGMGIGAAIMAVGVYIGWIA